MEDDGFDGSSDGSRQDVVAFIPSQQTNDIPDIKIQVSKPSAATISHDIETGSHSSMLSCSKDSMDNNDICASPGAIGQHEEYVHVNN